MNARKTAAPWNGNGLSLLPNAFQPLWDPLGAVGRPHGTAGSSMVAVGEWGSRWQATQRAVWVKELALLL